MSSHADDIENVAQELAAPLGVRSDGTLPAALARFWWVELLLGIAWLVVAVFVLKFNHASIVTVGIITGILFLAFAAEEFLLAVVEEGSMRWLWAFFGVLLTAGGIVSLVNPQETFAGFAEILGFVFLVIGVIWAVQAFTERAFNSLWWMGLISAILMIVLAFWVSAEFLVERAYTLLVFAGIWALLKGVTDIVRAFQLRDLETS